VAFVYIHRMIFCGLTHTVDSMFRQLKGYQLGVDITLAGVFFVVILPFIAHIQDLGSLLVLFGFSVALAFRRLSPGIALGIAWLAAIGQMASSQALQPGDAAVLGVLYATAAHGGRSIKWLGLASAGVGAAAATAYLFLTPAAFDYASGRTQLTVSAAILIPTGLFVASISTLGLSWTLGLLVRAMRSGKESRQLQERAERERRLVEYQMTVEQERNRIARDMHDVVAHSLAVVIAQADGARYSKASNPGVIDDSLSTIASTAREALGDVRMLLDQLRHSQADGPQPVLADLGRLYDQLRAAGLTILTETEGIEEPLSTAEQLAVYRIAQESLTNALRHGDIAQAVYVRSRWEQGRFTFAVHNVLRSGRDEATAFPDHEGHGIPGMTERATLVGGWLAAGQVDPGWYGVVLTLPTEHHSLAVA
jgi:signal transduction histidine kinase